MKLNKKKRNLAVFVFVVVLIIAVAQFDLLSVGGKVVSDGSGGTSSVIDTSEKSFLSNLFTISSGNCITQGNLTFCCSDSSHVFCDTNNLDGDKVCGTPGFCENQNNIEISCMDGGDWCCDEVGHVMDYQGRVCCPSTHPFYGGNNLCYQDYTKTETLNADNYYTRQSECFKYEEKCEGTNWFLCSGDKIYNWINKGTTMRKCNVQCIKESTCGKDVFGEKSCLGLKVIQNVKDFTCSNYQCSSKQVEKVVETCDFRCEKGECINGVKVYVLQNNICIEEIIDERERKNTDFDTMGECQGKIKFPISNVILIILIIGIIAILGYLFFKFRKK